MTFKKSYFPTPDKLEGQFHLAEKLRFDSGSVLTPEKILLNLEQAKALGNPKKEFFPAKIEDSVREELKAQGYKVRRLKRDNQSGFIVHLI